MMFNQVNFKMHPGFWHHPQATAAKFSTAAWQQQMRANNMQFGSAGFPQGGGIGGYGKPMFGGGVSNNNMGGQFPQQQQQGNPLLMQLLANAQQQHGAANQANEMRYRQLVDGMYNVHNEGMKLANARASQQYDQFSGQAAQTMVNRGLQGSMEDARGMFNAFEQSRLTPLNQFNRTATLPLQAIERRNDIGPNFGEIMKLAEMAGQSQSGINGQSSPLSQGMNIGSYPAAQGMALSRGRRRQPLSTNLYAPIWTGTMNPFGSFQSYPTVNNNRTPLRGWNRLNQPVQQQQQRIGANAGPMPMRGAVAGAGIPVNAGPAAAPARLGQAHRIAEAKKRNAAVWGFPANTQPFNGLRNAGLNPDTTNPYAQSASPLAAPTMPPTSPGGVGASAMQTPPGMAPPMPGSTPTNQIQAHEKGFPSVDIPNQPWMSQGLRSRSRNRRMLNQSSPGFNIGRPKVDTRPPVSMEQLKELSSLRSRDYPQWMLNNIPDAFNGLVRGVRSGGEVINPEQLKWGGGHPGKTPYASINAPTVPNPKYDAAVSSHVKEYLERLAMARYGFTSKQIETARFQGQLYHALSDRQKVQALAQLMQRDMRVHRDTK